MDVAAIEPGQDFRKAMDLSVAACNVLLAVIGPEWLDAENVAGVRRLDDPEDFVRIELASGLRRDILVVPVLVRGARMPRADQLPDDLKDLAYRNAVELTHARWKSATQPWKPLKRWQPTRRKSPPDQEKGLREGMRREADRNLQSRLQESARR